MSKAAVAYIRVSTEKQDLSPEAQKAAIELWSRSHGVEIVGWHEDIGISGSTDINERPGLMAAIAQVRVDHAVLIVAKRDRLARDTYVASMIERICQVVSADGLANGDDPSSALMRAILNGVAAFELALIRQRTKAALAAKKARGERVGTIPLGFTTSNDGKTLVQDEREHSAITHAKTLRSNGKSLNAIAKELNSLGYRTRSGGLFGAVQVSRVLAA